MAFTLFLVPTPASAGDCGAQKVANHPDGFYSNAAYIEDEEATESLAAGNYGAAQVGLRAALEEIAGAAGDEDLHTVELLEKYSRSLVGLGRYGQAEPIMQKVVRLRNKLQGAESSNSASSLVRLALILQRLGRLGEAVPKLQTLLTVLRARSSSQNYEDRVTLAFALSATGHLQESRQVLGQAVEQSQTERVSNIEDRAERLSMLASLLMGFGQFTESSRLFGEAVSLRPSVDRLEGYGEALEQQGRLREAEKAFAYALTLSRSSIGRADADAAAELASVRLRLPNLARFAIEPARLATRNDAEGFDSDEARRPSRIASNDLRDAQRFELLADAAWASGPGETPGQDGTLEKFTELRNEAFASLQRVLTNSTSRAMARNAALRAASAAGVQDVVLARENLMRAEASIDSDAIETLSQQCSAAIKRRVGLETSLYAARDRLSKLNAILKQKIPSYSELATPRPLDESEARSLLRPDEAALIIIPTERGTQVIAVTNSRLGWYRSSLNKGTIDHLVKRILYDVGANVQLSSAEAAQWATEESEANYFDFASAYKLYDSLIRPALGVISGKAQLFVSASGALSSLPLGILVSEIPSGPSGDPAVLRSAKWLSDQYAISVIPTLQSLQYIRQRQRKDESDRRVRPYLGFGDPLLTGPPEGRGRGTNRHSAGGEQVADTLNGPSIDLRALRRLPRLPGTAVEISEQWRAFGGPVKSLFLGQNATERKFKAMNIDVGVLSFATHGLLAGDLSGVTDPGLVLTPPRLPTTVDNGYLSAREISAMKISADWVILSACNTASGDGTAGAPGLSGLSRAFFYAGATNLLVSHWPVRDDVAPVLTVRAIEVWRSDPMISRATALQRAEREIRNDPKRDAKGDTWAHPAAWAPFSFVGDGASLAVASKP